MESEMPKEHVLFRLRIKHLAKVTVAIPLFSLLVCFVTAMTFQHKEVNQTVCRVFNVVPSISAITGIAPQCYIWRISVALHCTPRFLVSSVYYNSYRSRLDGISPAQQQRYLWWASASYWLSIFENASLIGCTYISNRENYPIHEKMFIIFMLSFMTYMLVNSIMYQWSRQEFTSLELKSYRWKIGSFITAVVSTLGLLYFFYRHRRFCDELAFSYFSSFEYCLVVCNMAYHMTVVWDFPEDEITVASTRYHNSTPIKNNHKTE